MSKHDRAPADRDATTRIVKWPPPGLERMQGDLVVIAGRAALAGMLLVFPLLFVAARHQDFATLGPFADAWWVTIGLATIGLAFGLDALTRLARSMRRAAHGLERGYDPRTIARVLVDSQRDMGFLLTGARYFSVLDEGERSAVAFTRVVAAALLTLSGLWLLVSFSVGLFLAARGVVSAPVLQGATLLPALLGYAMGGVATLVHEGRVRRARKVWYEEWSDDVATDEIRAWQAAAPGQDPVDDEARRRTSRALSRGAIGVAVLALVVALPVLTLVPSSAIAPVLTTISMPTYESYRVRAARAEAFRSYVVEADVAMTPAEAGRILQDLMFVGSVQEPLAGQRTPSRRMERPWFPDGEEADNPFGLLPYLWADSLIARAVSGIDDTQRAYLLDLTDHPASAAFARLSRASTLDAAAARWESPIPPGIRMGSLPMPSFRPLRDAARIHIGASALALADGRPRDAERLLQEVVTVGFLLADDGPTLLDNIVGYSLIEDGGGALTQLFRATGRPGDAAMLSRLNQVAERSAGLVQTEYARGAESFVRSLPGLIMDPTLMRGLRWEYFFSLTTMAPCLNMHRIVFGADEEYATFVEEARNGLVRWPSEETIFDLASRGWVDGIEAGDATLLGRIAGLYMSSDENSCAQFVRHMQAEELF